MKYPKLFQGELITIDGNAYMVITGLSMSQYPLLKNSKKRLVYNVQLRSVKYNPDRIPEYIYCKNTEVPPYTKVK